jgi:hypothetical protein
MSLFHQFFVSFFYSISLISALIFITTFSYWFWVWLIFLLLYWGYIVTFKKVLAIYHIWIRSFHHSSLSSLPIPGIVSTGTIILHLHTCVHNIYTIFTLLPTFLISFPSHWYPPPQIGHFFDIPVLHFCKKMTFLFV